MSRAAIPPAVPRALSFRRVVEIWPTGRRFLLRAYLRRHDATERRLLRDEGFHPWPTDARVWERPWISDIEVTPLLRSLLGRRYALGLASPADRGLARVEMRRLGFGPHTPIPVVYRSAGARPTAPGPAAPSPIPPRRHP